MDANTALELYKLASRDSVSWLNLHAQHSRGYFFLIITLFGASLGGSYHFPVGSWPTIALLLGPILGALLSVVAIRTCDRFYRRFLESITIQAKLERMIGLTKERSLDVDDDASIAFRYDTHYVPRRWLQARSKYGTSAHFVQAHIRAGVNNLLHWTFGFLIVANVLLFLSLLFFILLN